MTSSNMKLAMSRAMEAKKTRDAAMNRLDHHRETCPVCSKPGMSIDVMRNGKCIEGVKLADAMHIASMHIVG